MLRSSLLLLPLLLASAIPAPAQKLVWAANDGPLVDTKVTMGGPNLLLGIKFKATFSGPVIAMEVFTGRRTGQNSLALWSHNGTTNYPLKELGKGTWSMYEVESWQGTMLQAPVLLQKDTVYWAVWGPINSARASLDPTKTGQPTFPYRGSFDAGKSWNGPAAGWTPKPWKFRLYAPYQGGKLTPVGQGVPGLGQFAPKLDASGWANPGNEITLRIMDPAPAVPALLVGGRPVQIPAGPWTVYALPPLLMIPAQTANGRSPGEGDFILPLPIPNDPALQGYPVSFQAWILDSAGPLGATHTNGLTLVIG